MASRKTTKASAKTGPSFEQSIQRLEQLVAEMEDAELPLEEMLKKYEEGTRLVKLCGQKLDEAEKKIELLNRGDDGSLQLKPFDNPTAESTEAGDDQLL